MPVVSSIVLLIKGLGAIGEYIAAHGLAPKVAAMLMKSVAASGIVATMENVAIVGIVAGGVLWTRDRANNLIDGFKAIERGDTKNAVTKFALLAISTGIGAHALPDTVHTGLLHAGFSEEKAKFAATTIKSLEVPIADRIDQIASKDSKMSDKPKKKKSKTDDIYIENKYSGNIYVAIHYQVDGVWKTKKWCEFTLGETACLLSETLENRFIYCHAYSTDGCYVWGAGDYTESLNGKKRKFTKFDTGDKRGKFTIQYYKK